MLDLQQRSLVLLATMISSLLHIGCATTETRRVRGDLVFEIGEQVLTECGTGRVYLVETHTSSGFFRLSGRVNEVTQGLPEGTPLIADLEGPVGGIVSSAPPPFDDALEVFVIHSVEVGSCD